MKLYTIYSTVTIATIILVTISCGNDSTLTQTNTSDAPTNLTATAISRNEIKLTWKDNSSDEDGFNIERKEGPWGVFQIIARTEANVTTYDDKRSGLSPDTTYYYRVAYYRGSELSEYSKVTSEPTLKKAIPLRIIPEAYIILKFLEDYSTGSITGKTVWNGYSKAAWLESSGIWYEDFTVSVTEGEGGASYYTIDGTLAPDSCNNEKFVIKTLLPLYILPAYPCPVEGEILVVRGERVSTLRFSENQVVEIDTDDDMVMDDTVICQPVTDPDFCL